jgi:hypothetical protein
MTTFASARDDRRPATPVTSTPAKFDALFRSQVRRSTKVLRDSGLRLD